MKLIRGERQPIWYSVTAIVVSCLLATTVNMLYTRYEAKKTEQKFCAVIEVSVSAGNARSSSSPAPAPMTQYGRQQREAMRQLGKSLNCRMPGPRKS